MAFDVLISRSFDVSIIGSPLAAVVRRGVWMQPCLARQQTSHAFPFPAAPSSRAQRPHPALCRRSPALYPHGAALRASCFPPEKAVPFFFFPRVNFSTIAGNLFHCFVLFFFFFSFFSPFFSPFLFPPFSLFLIFLFPFYMETCRFCHFKRPLVLLFSSALQYALGDFFFAYSSPFSVRYCR